MAVSALSAPEQQEGRNRKRLIIKIGVLMATLIIVLATVAYTLYVETYALTDRKDYIPGCGANMSGSTSVNKTIIRLWTSSLFHHTEYPFMALLLLDFGTTETRSCGSTIITKRSILTAGHCLYNTTTVDIVLGVSNFLEASNWVMTFGDLIIHNNFDPSSYDNDISLINLNIDLEISDTINIISLNFNYINRRKTSGCGTVLGWGINMTAGLNEELLNKSVVLTDNEDCFNFYQDDFERDDSKIICTLGYHGPCYSDSGSPLLLENTQIGLVSAGDKDCTPNTPTKYTNLGYYQKWIESNANLLCDDSDDS